ncbi:MAG: HAD family phosphatase [Clostridia bacterium]|nr:HAD family phosphatase [Clostridia bacterium]
MDANGFAMIFDMDGVIFDTERLAAECWREVAAREGISGIDDVLMECTGVTADASRRIFARVYGGTVEYDSFREKAMALLPNKCPDGVLPMKAGALELLRWLADRKIPVALASSTQSAVVLRELREAGIDGYFQKIICGDMVSASKPDPEIFRTAAKALGVLPERCVVAEDSHNGVRAAFAAGMHPIMVPDRMPVTEEMRRISQWILPSLVEVQALLSRILSGEIWL